jgi:GNAT superfamily N-acetyltransferase
MLKLEHIDHTLLHVESLNRKHIPDLHTLWISQYLEVKKQYAYLPETWLEKLSYFARFIEQHTKNSAGIVITFRHAVIGFMAYDMFDFHGERTAFFPIMAHAADPAYKLVAYSTMYNHLSQVLVEQECLNHIVTFFSHDQELQIYLFELGFGLYVVDAYRDLSPIPQDMIAHSGRVRQATHKDLDDLFAIVKESDAFYAKAPLFLKRESETKAQIIEMLTSPDYAVFVAIDNDTIVGYMNIRCHSENNVQTLSDSATALIDPLGAYLRKEYRGRGIGKQLLHEVVTWSSQREITTIHVDFESANYYANQFWPKYFVPILASVRRHLNSDAKYTNR